MKDIKGYEGLYAITSCGRVWSYRSNKFLTPQPHNDGYLQVGLKVNGKTKMFLIHRLVAEAYIPNPLGLPMVNHKDEGKSHNWINNLEWCDNKYNTNYGTCNKRKSVSHKIPVYCVELDKVFDSAMDAGIELGIDKTSVTRCCRGKYKTCGGYHWMYAEEKISNDIADLKESHDTILNKTQELADYYKQWLAAFEAKNSEN